MNNILNKLERRFGRFAVPDLIKYVIVLYVAGAAIGLVNENFYYEYLSLNFEAILHGQVWRLFTYLIEPYGFNRGFGLVISILFFAIQVNLFFLFGRSLEQAWGTFRFNMYFLSGWFLNLAAALILYLSPLHATTYYSGFQYIYWAMFFAFASLNPNMQFLLYFVIPIKVKWLAWLDAAYLVYQAGSDVVKACQFLPYGNQSIALSDGSFITGYQMGGMYIAMAVAIVVAMGNFLIYFFSSRDFHRISPGEIHRRSQFKKKMNTAQNQNGGTRHRCAICGRTELDDPNLDFRYCSKCEGNYEYCSDHLFTHQHVKRH